MNGEEVLNVIVNALAEIYEQGIPSRCLDWKVFCASSAIPEEVGRRVIAQLRAERSVSAGFDGTTIQFTSEGYRNYRCQPTIEHPPMLMDLELLKYPQRFHELCRDLLAEAYPHFQSFDGSGGDEGIDGFEPDSATLFQFHMPVRGHRKEKLSKYLEQASQHPIKHWVLLTTRDLTVKLTRWLDSARRQYKFDIEIWGPARIHSFLDKYPSIAARYFGVFWPRSSGAISIGAQTARQIVNVAGPAVIKSERPSVKRAPIPGTAGADPYMKGELQKLVKRLGDFRSWDKGKDKSRSIFPAIHKTFLSNFGFSVYDTPKERFEEVVAYFNSKIDNTKIGRINKAKARTKYV